MCSSDLDSNQASFGNCTKIQTLMKNGSGDQKLVVGDRNSSANYLIEMIKLAVVWWLIAGGQCADYTQEFLLYIHTKFQDIRMVSFVDMVIG